MVKVLPEMCQKQPPGRYQKVSIPWCMQVLQVGGMEQVVPLEEELSNHQTPLASLPTEIQKLASAVSSQGLHN